MKKLVNFLFDFTDKVICICGQFGAAMVVLMLFLTIYEIIMRYVFNNAPMLADEICGYMLVAMVSVGLAYRWREGGHVRVEAFASRLPLKVQYWVRLFTLTAVLFFTVMVTLGSLTMVGRTIGYNLMSNTWLRVPLIWPQLFIPFGFMLLSLYILGTIGRHLINRRELQNADWRRLDE